MKYKSTPYRKKRVFIDLEYITKKDLQKSMEEIFLLISEGNERNRSLKYYKTVELLSEFKQWYVNPKLHIKEAIEGDKIIHTIKGSF